MVIRRNNTFVNRFKEGMWDWPAKRLNLNAMMITPESLNKFLRQAKRAKLQFLWGYEGGIHHVALFLKKHNIEFPTQLKAVISTSSPLPDAHRALFKQIFHCDVYDQYGSCEVQWLGTECPHHHGLHIPWDIRRVEIVDANGSQMPRGEMGDVVVTDLLNRSFPFIRYRNGDRCRMLDRDTDCTIPFPLLDAVKGRVTDLVKFPDGSCIAGDYLTTIFDRYPMAVEAFQVIQRKDGSVELHYVPSNTPESPKEIALVVEGLKKLIGDRAVVKTFEEREIRHDRGKTRFVLSEME
jgi:phenylacetate-CoA ligase